MNPRAIAMASALVLGAQSLAGAQAPERVRPNDNQARAGISLGGQLAVRMEARLATWFPDGDDRPGIQVPAFAEVGRPAQVPGPLIRARGGTEVVVIVRNLIPNASLTIHGLHARPAIAPIGMTFNDSIVVAPGAVQTVRFRLDRPGTYYYWGTITNQPLSTRMHEDAQLTGAIVVDEPGERTPRDRIFVIGMLTDTTRSDSLRRRQRELVVVNGRSWPTTDRIQYEQGNVVRWRVINASVDAHSMHLHGFHYRVTRRGDAMADTALLTRAELVHTERVASGGTFSAEWVANRLGNWIFHCEEPGHSSQRGPLGYPLQVAAGGIAPSSRGLGGLVTGVEISRAEEDTTWKLPPPPVQPATRRLRLVLRPGIGSTSFLPLYGVSLLEGGLEPLPSDTGQHVGPTLLLNRGEQTSVTVVNNLPEATSIHWHGLEVESLYDGVPGFSGVKPIPIKGEPPPTTSPWAPLLAPGDSFEVRLAPPRAGTFAYHASVNVERQERAGVVGAIVVADKGKHDPTRDFTVLYSSPSDSVAEEAGILVNGALTPPVIELRRATAYRLRLLNFATGRPDLSIELKQDSTLAGWRLIARDGAELVADRMLMPARMPLAVGQTRDVEFLPLRAGEYRLEARTPSGWLLSTLILRVN